VLFLIQKSSIFLVVNDEKAYNTPPMKMSALLSSAIGLLLTFTPVLAFAELDTACLNTAITDRSKNLKDAYKNYSDDMGKAVDAVTKNEQDAIKNKDINYMGADTARAFANFAYNVGDTWNRLNVTIFQAWNNYYGRRASCGYGGSAAPINYGGGYSYGNNYGRIPVQCTAPVLRAPRAGCGYECASDENGCQRCRETCRSPVSYSACGCPPLYDPVCTRSGLSYDNACIAVCRGEKIWYDGSCR